ncbi:hypothetical protein [Listeria fleischmannii]|uniref:hypothetical protein n=1 Tax=Listeria fleischmannii TaxID=1069827 RepID=UPI0004B4887E|nr:hypothetical protein [Listeria fleischmannii]
MFDVYFKTGHAFAYYRTYSDLATAKTEIRKAFNKNNCNEAMISNSRIGNHLYFVKQYN